MAVHVHDINGGASWPLEQWDKAVSRWFIASRFGWRPWCCCFPRRGRRAGGVRRQCGGADLLLHRALPGRCRAAGGRPPGAQQEGLPLLVPLAAAFQTLPSKGHNPILLLLFKPYNPTLPVRMHLTYFQWTEFQQISHRCNQTPDQGLCCRQRLRFKIKSNEGLHLTTHLNELTLVRLVYCLAVNLLPAQSECNVDFNKHLVINAHSTVTCDDQVCILRRSLIWSR